MFKAEIIGNLGRDAELKRGNDGNYVVFNVCHSVKYRDRDGNEVVNQLWASCTRNGDGGRLLPWLKKGQKVYVRGNVSSRTYRGHDGNWHSGINISVDEIELVGASPETAAPAASGQSEALPRSGAPNENANDENIPF